MIQEFCFHTESYNIRVLIAFSVLGCCFYSDGFQHDKVIDACSKSVPVRHLLTTKTTLQEKRKHIRYIG